MSKITVKSKRPGFRRAGHTFSDTEGTVLDTAKLTEAELEAIKTDPGLIVVEGEASSGGKGKADLKEGRQALDADRAALEADRAALKKEQQALADDRKALDADRDALNKDIAAFQKPGAGAAKK